ncbi:MAG TPA: hypothetical protein VMU22_03625 [Rhizomicrobium sp.]|nr:hypothetical protein [Rhizomicrobium sp.]
MAEKPKSLLDGGPANALDAGAARFDRLIEEVRAQHAAPAQAPAAPQSNPLLPVSPGEAWARNFQSHSIGPETRGVALSDLAAVPRAAIVPPVSAADLVPGRSAEAVAPKAVETAPMSVQIGRGDRLERPKTSWLGRMFGRS